MKYLHVSPAVIQYMIFETKLVLQLLQLEHSKIGLLSKIELRIIAGEPCKTSAYIPKVEAIVFIKITATLEFNFGLKNRFKTICLVMDACKKNKHYDSCFRMVKI